MSASAAYKSKNNHSSKTNRASEPGVNTHALPRDSLPIEPLETYSPPPFQITAPPPTMGAARDPRTAKPEPDPAIAYDVIRFPVIDWDFRWQRPQQLSRQFAVRGHRVFYMTTEVACFPKEHAGRDEVCRFVKFKKVDRNVWLVTLCAHRRLNLYQDQMDDLDIQYLKWSLEHVLAKFAITSYVSIVDLPFWTPLAAALNQHNIIYDCMDDHSGFSTNHANVIHQEDLLIQKSNVVLTSSQVLHQRVREQKHSTILVRNAADVSHFAGWVNNVPAELSSIAGPVIGYYGAISDWFDIGLIEVMARNRPEWTFALIGHTFGCDTSGVEQLPNVLLLGEKPYEEVPGYLHRFDCAIIPFVQNNLTQATNPVKLYEYLAAGKPVVSTPLPELTEIASGVAEIADSPAAFEAAVERALRMEAVQPEAVRHRRKFAMNNTWRHRYEMLHGAILQHIFPKVSIVIVTHNNWSFTRQCLNSLTRKGGYPNAEIIVVDNGSTDQTRAQLAALAQKPVQTVFSPINLGFAGGNSLGASCATGEYVILLNNDTIVPDATWIPKLIRPMQEHNDIAMTGPMSNHVGNDQALDFFIGDPVQGADPGWLQEFYDSYREGTRETGLLGFFCVAIRRSAFEKIGPLDHRYGIGMFEDDDYCERVKQAGYRMVIVEDAFVYHHGSATIKKLKSQEYQSLWERNKQYYEAKWNTTWQLPEGPLNPFNLAATPEEVRERIEPRNTGEKWVLLLSESSWSNEPARWQQLAKQFAQSDGCNVIVYALTYLQHPVVGIRKAGPRLYLTNRIDLFSRVTFDLAVYCGSQQVFEEIHAGRYAADAMCYKAGQIEQLAAELPEIQLYDEPQASRLVQQSLA
ncbi:glycosyl transferase family 2 [Paenibacillus sp. XY044]|nr:glycosyl transferase family 2 [Paenibacillus sp. XY044]